MLPVSTYDFGAHLDVCLHPARRSIGYLADLFLCFSAG